MIAHSVNTFRNCSVVHDLSTSKDYSTILYKCVSMGRGKKLNESEKKQILELKQQQLSVFFFFLFIRTFTINSR